MQGKIDILFPVLIVFITQLSQVVQLLTKVE